MPQDKLNLRELSEQYGFAYSMLRSNDELYSLFKRAVSQTWDQDRIMTEVRGTKWYRRNSESQRNAEALKATDPATYKQGLQQQRVRVRMMAVELGARISSKRIRELADHVYAGGWDDNQLRQTLGRFIRFTDGRMMGQAGAMTQEWNQYADQMGMKYGHGQMKVWASRVAQGKMTPQDVLSRIQEAAASKYVGFADRIKAGETVASVAEPYKQSMAEVLELNPEDLNIRTSKWLKRALMAKNADGRPEPMALWEFEDKLRHDPRWNSTDNAQDTLMETGRQVLRDFGLTS